MILHLCHHWFWITSLGVLLIMSVIASAHTEELGNRNTSHPPERSKFKAVLLNITRLYPVSEIVPDGTPSSAPEGIVSSNPEEVRSIPDNSSNIERVSHPHLEQPPSLLPKVYVISTPEVSLGPTSSEVFHLNSTEPLSLSSKGDAITTPERFYPHLHPTELPVARQVGQLSSEVEVLVPESLSSVNKLDNFTSVDKRSRTNTSSNADDTSSLTSSSSGSQSSNSSDESSSDKSSDKSWSRIDTALFASESVESRELPSQPSVSPSSTIGTESGGSPTSESKGLSGGSTVEKASVPILPTPSSRPVTLGDTEVLLDSDTNQSERLEREIRKNSTVQSFDKVDRSSDAVDKSGHRNKSVEKVETSDAANKSVNPILHLHPSFEPGSDGLEHDKLTQHTQEFVRRISTTVTPVNKTREVKSEEPYTIFVTPASPYHDLTTSEIPVSPTTHQAVQPIEIVKKSDGLSKIKDKVDFKAKFAAKNKEKTTPLKVVETSTGAQVSQGTTSSQSVEVTTGSTQLRTNVSRLENYEVLNDSPESGESPVSAVSPSSQENVTELAFENTSISADYEDTVNLTASANLNSSMPRTPALGRALDTHERLVESLSRGRALDKEPSSAAHAEDLNATPWGDDVNVALISGVSFGALALVTLFGAVSFILYRRYRWNKPQTLSDKCSNPDSSGYIDDSTLRENSEEMYSLDNDSFLNSLEAMTIQNYWTDHVKHTKL